MKLSPKGQKILKSIHLVTTCAWIGGAVALTTLYFAKQGIEDAGVIIGINTASRWIDMAVVVILGAFGCFFTGLVYSAATPWGFFKHRWVVAKWILTIAMIAFGTFFLGPREEGMLQLSTELGQAVFNSASYAQIQGEHIVGSLIQLLAMVGVVYLSVWKPWRK